MLRRNIVAAAAVLPLAALATRAFAQDAKTPTTTPTDGTMPDMGD